MKTLKVSLGMDSLSLYMLETEVWFDKSKKSWKMGSRPFGLNHLDI